MENVRKLSNYFHVELNKIQKQYPKIIKEVRGKGYLIGLQLFFDQTKFISQPCFSKNLSRKLSVVPRRASFVFPVKSI